MRLTADLARTHDPAVHIIILGHEGVGKSALAVRFLTRRFLSEYAQCEEMSYDRTIALDADRHVALRVTDVSGKSLQTRAASRELLLRADAAVLVYSVTDQASVTAVRHALACLRKFRPSAAPHVARALVPAVGGSSCGFCQYSAAGTTKMSVASTAAHAQSMSSLSSCGAPVPFPVLLLGNKSDLDHVRTVQRLAEGPDWTADFTLSSECSARDDAEGVTALFHNLIRKVLEIRTANTRSARKLSQGMLGSPSQLTTTIKRRLSMFSRDRVSTL